MWIRGRKTASVCHPVPGVEFKPKLYIKFNVERWEQLEGQQERNSVFRRRKSDLCVWMFPLRQTSLRSQMRKKNKVTLSCVCKCVLLSKTNSMPARIRKEHNPAPPNYRCDTGLWLYLRVNVGLSPGLSAEVCCLSARMCFGGNPLDLPSASRQRTSDSGKPVKLVFSLPRVAWIVLVFCLIQSRLTDVPVSNAGSRFHRIIWDTHAQLTVSGKNTKTVSEIPP